MLRIPLMTAVLALAASLTSPATAAVITTPTGLQDTGTGLSWLRLDATSSLSFDALSPQLASGGTLASYRLATGVEVGALVTARFAGLTGDAVRTAFFDFVSALGATPLRDAFGGTGDVLELGGVIAATGPAVSLVPVNSSGTVTGPASIGGTHRAYIVAGTGLLAGGSPAQIVHPVFGGTALPDRFATGYALSPLTNANFSSLQINQGFFTSQSLEEFVPVTAGFWLVQAAPPPPTAVPEPASAALLGAGLLCLATLRGRRGVTEPPRGTARG